MSLFKKLTPSQSLVKQSLRGHAWMGLFFSAMLYLICFTGALVVFFPEMERWEQPLASEYKQISNEAIEKAVDAFQEKIKEPIESLYLVYPNSDLPRAHVSANDQEWWLSEQGDLLEPVSAPWTEMLTSLHIYLHLPKTLGIIIVGMLGAMMCGLMISGLLSHPNLFKDAFKLRLGSNRHLEQTDIHNRLSVWGLPFFFVISLTGGYIGLFGVSMTVVDWIEKDHDSKQIIEQVFGGDPSVTSAQERINYKAITQDLIERAPTAQPIYMVIQKPGTGQQFIELAAAIPERLIYSEIYRYRSNGDFIDYQHLSDGDLGRQVAYSSYRVHFGHFGGMPTKVLYFILGMAMAIITATGVNMWFDKRKLRNKWYAMWHGFIWATPAAVSLSAVASIILNFNAVSSFWLALLTLTGLSLLSHNYKYRFFEEKRWVSKLKWLTTLSVITLIFSHGFKHPNTLWYWTFGFIALLIACVPLVNFRWPKQK